jgi:hypothetical protein
MLPTLFAPFTLPLLFVYCYFYALLSVADLYDLDTLCHVTLEEARSMIMTLPALLFILQKFPSHTVQVYIFVLNQRKL